MSIGALWVVLRGQQSVKKAHFKIMQHADLYSWDFHLSFDAKYVNIYFMAKFMLSKTKHIFLIWLSV